MKLLITGGAGFIGSNFARYWYKTHPNDEVVILDALTYAGHLQSLKDIFGEEVMSTHPPGMLKDPNHKFTFIRGDITDLAIVKEVMNGVDTVVHFAAESHVDRSVIDPLVFVRTNVLGTATLLEAALDNKVKKFHHISTDEVFGDLEINDPPFDDKTPYNPRTPYSASKAGSDHLVRAFHKTYGLPITITNCANNYGFYHDPEKLIPRFITNLLQGEKVPLMGKGENIREWLHVMDHARAIDLVLEKGEPGETYLVQGEEKKNIEVTKKILQILDMDESYIEYVEDRLGHDKRYANDGGKLEALGFKKEHNFDEWLEKTVEWYKENEWWWKPLLKDRPNVDRSAQKSYGQ